MSQQRKNLHTLLLTSIMLVIENPTSVSSKISDEKIIGTSEAPAKQYLTADTVPLQFSADQRLSFLNINFMTDCSEKVCIHG